MPPLFTICAADPGVTALLGEGPTRLYPFDEAPQKAARPYAVYQVLTGVPENYLADRPDLDSWMLQIDIYADTGAEAIAVRDALQYAIETHAQITRIGGTRTERETKLKTTSLDVSWLVKRPVPAPTVSPYVMLIDDTGAIWTDENGNPWIEER